MCTILGSCELQSQRTCQGHYTHPPFRKKPQNQLYFLRKQKANVLLQVLINFYRESMESILTGNVTDWHFSCTIQNRKDLQQGIKTAQNVVSTVINNIGVVRGLYRAQRILKDNTHPSNNLSTLLPSATQKYPLPYHQAAEQLRIFFGDVA